MPRRPRRTLNITGTVRCYKSIMNSVCIRNDVGGTVDLPVGTYRVRLVDCWYDDETGRRCVGQLLDPADVEESRRVGTTGYPPEHYRRYNEGLYQRTLEAARTFDPSRVYFHLDDFTADPGTGVS